MTKLPALPGVFPDALVRRIAMDIGKEVVAYIEHASPQMFDNVAAKSAKLSIRNATYNIVMAAVGAADEGDTEETLARHDKHRREMRRLQKLARLAEQIRCSR